MLVASDFPCTYYFIADPADYPQTQKWTKSDNLWIHVGHDQFLKRGDETKTLYEIWTMKSGRTKIPVERMEPVRSSLRGAPSPMPTPLPSSRVFNVNARAKPNPPSTQVVLGTPLRHVADERKQAHSPTTYIKGSSERVAQNTPGRTTVACARDLFKVTVASGDEQQRTPRKPGKTSVRAVLPAPPQEPTKTQTWVMKSNTIATKRGSQNGTMGGWGALNYAKKVGFPDTDKLNDEWLHLVARSAGGMNAPTNFVAGTYDANTWMIPFEAALLALAKKLTATESITYTVEAKLWCDAGGKPTHVAESICLSAELPERMFRSGQKFHVEILATSNTAMISAVTKMLTRALSESIDRPVKGLFGHNSSSTSSATRATPPKPPTSSSASSASAVGDGSRLPVRGHQVLPD